MRRFRESSGWKLEQTAGRSRVPSANRSSQPLSAAPSGARTGSTRALPRGDAAPRPRGSADQLHPLSTRRKAAAVPTAHARGSASGSRVATRPRGAAPANQRGPGRGFLSALPSRRWTTSGNKPPLGRQLGTEGVCAPGGDGDPPSPQPAPRQVGLGTLGAPGGEQRRSSVARRGLRCPPPTPHARDSAAPSAPPLGAPPSGSARPRLLSCSRGSSVSWSRWPRAPSLSSQRYPLLPALLIRTAPATRSWVPCPRLHRAAPAARSSVPCPRPWLCHPPSA